MDKKEAIRQWAINQVGAAYVYGATGGLCTPALREDRCKQYPAHAASIRQYCPVQRGEQSACAGCRTYGRSAFDCAGFTRKAMELGGIRLPGGASSQWQGDHYARKGAITGEAARQLCLLFRAGEPGDYPMQHVGLSLGDGRVVDARSHKSGVVLTGIGDYPWTHYAIPVSLDVKGTVALKQGDRGETVRSLQRLLMGQGEALPRYGADGIFGQETLVALNAFQARLGLPISALVNEDTMQKLRAAPRQALGVEERLGALERKVSSLTEALKGVKSA